MRFMRVIVAALSLNVVQTQPRVFSPPPLPSAPSEQALTPAVLSFRLVISLGGKHIRVGIIHRGRLIQASRRLEDDTAVRLLRRASYFVVLSDALHDAIRQLPWAVRFFGRLTEVIVGVPGIQRDGRMIAIFNLPFLRGLRLDRRIAMEMRHVGLNHAPVTVMNDLALEARAVQRYVHGRFLYLNAGTGLNAVVMDGPHADVLEFGALRRPDGKTIEERYQEANVAGATRDVVASFIDELVHLLSVADIRQLVLAGGAVDHRSDFHREMLRQLAERRLQNVIVLPTREDGDQRGLLAALVETPARSPDSPRAAALRARYETVQRGYEALWAPGRTLETKKRWRRQVGVWVRELADQGSDFASWTPEERQLAGLTAWKLRQMVQHLSRSNAPEWASLRAWLLRIDDQLLHASHYPSMQPDVQLWRNDFFLAGVRTSRLNVFHLNTARYYIAKAGTLIVDAWDVLRLVGIPEAGLRVMMRQNSPDFLRELRVLAADDSVLFALKLARRNANEASLALLIQKLASNPIDWLADVLAPWLAERGFQTLHIPYPHLGMERLAGATERGSRSLGNYSVDIDIPALLAARRAA